MIETVLKRIPLSKTQKKSSDRENYYLSANFFV
jgi:hypothetical protein